jgi:hypothetical protein
MRLLGLLGAGSALLLALGAALADADSMGQVEHASLPNRRAPAAPQVQSSGVVTHAVYFPFVGKAPPACPAPGGSYGTVAVIPYTPRMTPAADDPDINLALRGYTPTVAYPGLIDSSGGPPSDPSAPPLYNLFTDQRVPAFSGVYQVYNWDWSCNCRGAPITDYPVTLAGFGVAPGEPVCAPGSGYDIGWAPAGYAMMVLYADAARVTLKYTREDNVVNGYTIHIEHISVDPNLLALYQSMDRAGRVRLPALFAGQAIGSAITTEVGVAIRDTGTFLDPRSRQDWWQGK